MGMGISTLLEKLVGAWEYSWKMPKFTLHQNHHRLATYFTITGPTHASLRPRCAAATPPTNHGRPTEARDARMVGPRPAPHSTLQRRALGLDAKARRSWPLC